MNKKRDIIQNEALSVALKHQRVGLGISMGVGKTLIGLRYIEHFQSKNMNKLKVLVVAPKLSIFDSWKQDAEKFDISLDGVNFTTYLSLYKKKNIYDIIILDECHSLLYSHDEYLSGFKGRILGLTGTPPKWSNSEKGEMVGRYCPIMYNYITDDAIDDDILNDYKIIVHRMPLSHQSDIYVSTRHNSFYTSEYKNYHYSTKRVQDASTAKQKQLASIMRMKSMMGYKTKEKYTKKLLEQIKEKCIVFCNTQDQADMMCKYSYHSGNPESEENLLMFKNDNIDKLSCVLQLNEGVNIPNLRAGIIMHAYGNERKASQRIGRLLRLNPDEQSTVHILCYKDTVDEKWIQSALEDFDNTKITYIDVE